MYLLAGVGAAVTLAVKVQPRRPRKRLFGIICILIGSNDKGSRETGKSWAICLCRFRSKRQEAWDTEHVQKNKSHGIDVSTRGSSERQKERSTPKYLVGGKQLTGRDGSGTNDIAIPAASETPTTQGDAWAAY